MDPPWTIVEGRSPIIAAAIHHGHDLRPEVQRYMALSGKERRREEDPFTAHWTAIAPTRIVVHRSRFEVDLNRPPGQAVYRSPEDAWGLRVWRRPLPSPVVATSLVLHSTFYEQVRQLLDERIRRWGYVVVLDLHVYNYRRGGPGGPADCPADNPDINIGTGTMPRPCWAALVERVIRSLCRSAYLGQRLDVRENVRFQGGYFPRWIHEKFPGRACALAVEVKKFFMDEWTGQADRRSSEAIQSILQTAADDISTDDGGGPVLQRSLIPPGLDAARSL